LRANRAEQIDAERVAAVVRLAEPLQRAVGDVDRLNLGEQLPASLGLARCLDAPRLTCGEDAPIVRADERGRDRNGRHRHAGPQTSRPDHLASSLDQGV
jgi:hypothetical protein